MLIVCRSINVIQTPVYTREIAYKFSAYMEFILIDPDVIKIVLIPYGNNSS
jgi:hypothetical protein